MKPILGQHGLTLEAVERSFVDQAPVRPPVLARDAVFLEHRLAMLVERAPAPHLAGGVALEPQLVGPAWPGHRLSVHVLVTQHTQEAARVDLAQHGGRA
jgi:hypothetical protein